MTEPPPFVYDPLPAGYIRLLTPTSSETADGHIWKSQTLALDQENLEFDALSYVWGSASELLNIYLDGYVTQVHHNLHTALPCLARRGDVRPVRPIWIDAICINQADHEEKMVQIREMNRVYKQAKKVWVWLGTTKYQERIPDALRFLKELAEHKRSRHFESIDDEEERLNLETVEMPVKLALHHIISNDWFGRLWVIQEAALAHDLTFLCGDNECSWETLNDALKDGTLWTCLKYEFRRCQYFAELCDESVQIEQRQKYGKGTIFSIRIIVKTWRSAKDIEAVNAQALMLAITMLISCSHVCLKPEDRVLGLLGLVDAEVLRRTCLDPEIAYVSVEDLFTRATRFVFAFAAPPDRAYLWEWLRSAFKVDKRTGLPSWVPDFHSPGLRTLGPVEFECERPSRYAAVNKVLCSRDGLGSDELVLKGTVVDEVMTAFAIIPSPSPGQYLSRPEERGLLFAVADWENMIANDVLGHTSIDDEAWQQQGLENHRNLRGYWQTLINNQMYYMDEVISHDWYLDFQTMARQLKGIMVDTATQKLNTGPKDPQTYASVADTEDVISAEDRFPNAYKFLDAMQEFRNKQLFKTKKGLFSITMSGVRPGDVLVALNGAPMLHVIKKVTAATDHEPEIWKFVGDAYVHPLERESHEVGTFKESYFEDANIEEGILEESNADEAEDEEREFVFV